jgi:hypothetical protein
VLRTPQAPLSTAALVSARGPEAKWSTEARFLVSELDARATGERHGQNAVAWGKAEGVASRLDSLRR